MNLQKFYQDTVCVTMKDLGDEKLNKAHMVLGFGSEILDELVRAISSKDDTNYREEIGDAEWFMLGYMKYYGIVIPEETPNMKDFVFGYVEKIYSAPIEDYPGEEMDIMMMYLFHTTGVFQAILKKEITSNVMKYEGQIVEHEWLTKICHGFLYALQTMACFKLGDEEFDNSNALVFPGPIHSIREKIHAKLVLRHSGKAMTTESDLQRNTSEERKLLED